MTVTCPNCGKESPSYQGYAIHHSRAGYEGIPLVDLVGQEKLIDLYWTKSYEEIADELGVGSTTVNTVFAELDVPGKTEANRLTHKYGVPLPWLLDTLHNTLEKSVNQMSRELDVSRVWIDRRMLEHGISKRGRSEAERVKWEQMSEGEREQQVSAAHKKVRELVEDGGHALQNWREENPQLAREHSKRVGALGAPAREKNGMEGVSGQDHPAWRGGKSIYDAVKKQLRPSFATVRDEYRDETCQLCGISQAENGRTLDVHHIVPLLCGGTNDEWNSLTLCTSCHHRTESYTRDLLDPVLTE